MVEYHYSLAHTAFIKECRRCHKTFVGGINQEVSEKIFTIHFAQDRATKDGFYARCRACVSSSQRGNRDGRRCDPDILLEQQDNKCGICEKEITFKRESLSQAKVTAYVDHNHTTNKVRGILCPRCNSQLGLVEDKEWLSKALSYLQKYEG